MSQPCPQEKKKEWNLAFLQIHHQKYISIRLPVFEVDRVIIIIPEPGFKEANSLKERFSQDPHKEIIDAQETRWRKYSPNS